MSLERISGLNSSQDQLPRGEHGDWVIDQGDALAKDIFIFQNVKARLESFQDVDDGLHEERQKLLSLCNEGLRITDMIKKEKSSVQKKELIGELYVRYDKFINLYKLVYPGEGLRSDEVGNADRSLN